MVLPFERSSFHNLQFALMVILTRCLRIPLVYHYDRSNIRDLSFCLFVRMVNLHDDSVCLMVSAFGNFWVASVPWDVISNFPTMYAFCLPRTSFIDYFQTDSMTSLTDWFMLPLWHTLSIWGNYFELIFGPLRYLFRMQIFEYMVCSPGWGRVPVSSFPSGSYDLFKGRCRAPNPFILFFII